MSKSRFAGFGVSAITSSALALGAWAFLYEPSRFETVHYDIPLAVAGWGDADTPTKNAPPLTIALLSDIHAGSPYFGLQTIERVVGAVNEARPDLVLLAGDYVVSGIPGGRFVPPEELAEVLRGLEAPLGVYAVLGNHDVWLDEARVERAFEAVGIALLSDEAIRLPVPVPAQEPVTATDETRAGFWLVGLNDSLTSRPDVDQALSAIDDDAPVIAFTHNPDLFPRVPERVALTLAGHTHGGQVRLPFIGTPVVPSKYGSRYARGLIVEEGRTLFVTSGLGTSIFPVRFGVPPEVAVLRVHVHVHVHEHDQPRPTRATSAVTVSSP
jgi:predicted MPP superfamily phosphohydrolase